MDIAAGIASLDAALKIAKGIKGVEKAYDQVTLKGEVVDLMGSLYDVKEELMEAAQAISARDAEIERLKSALAAKDTLIEGPNGYLWADRGEGLKLGYPVCPTCLDREGHQIQLKQDGLVLNAKCPRCSGAFSPVESFLPVGPGGTQKTASQAAAEKRAATRARSNSQFRDLGSWMA